MCIRLGIFHHDALIFWRASPKVRARGEHFIHNSTSIFGCLKVKIQITFDCFNAADPLHAPDISLDLLGNFLGPLRNRKFFPFSRAQFERTMLLYPIRLKMEWLSISEVEEEYHLLRNMT